MDKKNLLQTIFIMFLTILKSKADDESTRKKNTIIVWYPIALNINQLQHLNKTFNLSNSGILLNYESQNNKCNTCDTNIYEHQNALPMPESMITNVNKFGYKQMKNIEDNQNNNKSLYPKLPIHEEIINDNIQKVASFFKLGLRGNEVSTLKAKVNLKNFHNKLKEVIKDTILNKPSFNSQKDNIPEAVNGSSFANSVNTMKIQKTVFQNSKSNDINMNNPNDFIRIVKSKITEEGLDENIRSQNFKTVPLKPKDLTEGAFSTLTSMNLKKQHITNLASDKLSINTTNRLNNPKIIPQHEMKESKGFDMAQVNSSNVRDFDIINKPSNISQPKIIKTVQSTKTIPSFRVLHSNLTSQKSDYEKHTDVLLKYDNNLLKTNQKLTNYIPLPVLVNKYLKELKLNKNLSEVNGEKCKYLNLLSEIIMRDFCQQIMVATYK